ncbi:MAG: non-homologous end-joining DNA ligase [Acidimicrobiia bacterium]
MSLPDIQPMLASPWPEPFSDDDWSFEVKWDGVRVLLYWDGETTRLRSRSGRDITDTYPEVKGFCAPAPLVIDGEVVAMDSDGRPSFERLQSRMNLSAPGRITSSGAAVPVSFIAFDLPHFRGDFTHAPLEERRAELDNLDLPSGFVTSEAVDGAGDAIWQFVTGRGLEGMIAKRKGSRYTPGERSPDWRKIPRRMRARAVVAGFTPGSGARTETFGALVLGMWRHGSLQCVGSVGTGFDDGSLSAIREALGEMTLERSPFPPDQDVPTATWVHPALVAVVEFKEWTVAQRMRAPAFVGFTDDDPLDVTWDAEGP